MKVKIWNMDSIKPKNVEEIKALLAQGELTNAFKVFKNTDLAKEALKIEGRFQDLEKRNLKGLLTDENYRIAKNILINDAVELADLLEKGQSIFSARSRFYFLILGIMLVCGLVWWGINQNTSPFKNDSTYNVLLLPFNPLGNCEGEDNLYHQSVKLGLETINETEILNLDVHCENNLSIEWMEAGDIKVYGSRIGADLVIYGYYQENCNGDSTYLDLHYLLLDTSIYSPERFRKNHESGNVSDKLWALELQNGKLTGKVQDIIYWTLGMREFNRSDYQNALEYFQRINIPPEKIEYAFIFFQLGYIFEKLSQYDSSLLKYNKAIELDTTYANAYNNRGSLLKLIGQDSMALEDYDMTIRLNENDADAYYNRGILYATDSSTYEDAFQDYSKTLEIDSQYVNAYVNRGNLLRSMQKFDEAWNNYTMAIEIDPSYAAVYNNRGILLINMDSLEAALEDANKAIELEPETPNSFGLRGWIYYLNNQYEKALLDWIEISNLGAMELFNIPVIKEAINDSVFLPYQTDIRFFKLFEHVNKSSLDPKNN